MSVSIAPVRAELAGLVSPAPLLIDSAACAALAVDGKIPDCAVAPATAEQVAAVLHYAAEHQLGVIPRGHGTKLSTGNIPRRYDVSLAVRELNRVIHFEPADLTISVEAGMSFGDLQEHAGRNGLWLPLDPRGGRQASVGGIIAANAAGPLRQLFGGPRDMVLGLKIATTEGKLVKTGGRVVKNVAGYDLGKLLTGSFGTLGVIVEACLKLFPKPSERATFALHVGTLSMARDLRRGLLRSPLDPMRLVLLDSTAALLVRNSAEAPDRSGAELWIEVGGSHRVIERCLHELRQLTSTVGVSLVRVEKAEEDWQNISDLALWLQQKYRHVTVLKAALPLASSEEFVVRARKEIQPDRIAAFVQVGVGVVYVCLLDEAPNPNAVGLTGRLRQAAAELGGTLVIEHCPLELKRQLDVWGAAGDDIECMRKLKSVWDPNGVLAPGRFVGAI